MFKYITTILSALLVAEVLCQTSCPLGELHEDGIEDLLKMNGTWSDYKKTADFLTTITCFTYDFNCPNGTACEVDLQNKTKQETIDLTNIDTDIKWGDEKVYINIDTENRYAIFWNCEDSKNGTLYELAVLMQKVTNETITKKIEDILKGINVTYKSEPQIIDYDACNDATMLTISIAIIFVATSSFL